jgi:SAM-dependent methyltransferase
MDNPDYIKINRNSWNKRTEIHVDSDFYDVKSFVAGKSSLNEIELNLLGDLSGKTVLHLQCHFGQDTISLSRLGANATGVDLSDVAIKKAQDLAIETESSATFICSDIYDLGNHLDERFDIVFTSYGTIGWLPDIDKWAGIVSQFLNPGGRFVFVEFHPVVWMFDDAFKEIKYRYFKSDAIDEIEQGTYTDRHAPIEQEYVSWNHGLAEVVSSLLNQNLEINSLEEFDYSPYNCFDQTVKIEDKKFRIKHLDNKIPMVYALSATKK